MDTTFLPLAGIVGALFLGVISPGPSFIMVAREAMSLSRGNGLAAAVGMGLGGAAFGTLALLGVNALFVAVPALYVLLKLAGGAYLCWLGWRIAGGAREPLPEASADGRAARSVRGSLAYGLVTQLSNPKTAVVYASVFAAFLPGAVTLVQGAALLATIFVMETGWYAVVAVVLSAPGPRATYARCKAWIDRGAGAVMAGLGVRLVVGAVRA